MKIDICIPCPVCASQGYNTKREYWRHHGYCNGILCVDEYAVCSCKRCGKEAHLSEMRFLCPENRHKFEVASVNGFMEAITGAAQMVNSASKDWLLNVLKRL